MLVLHLNDQFKAGFCRQVYSRLILIHSALAFTMTSFYQLVAYVQSLLEHKANKLMEDFDLHALPEDCVANVLSLTSPKDACCLSAVSPTFRFAALSDAVWERFLPSDYRQIISRSLDFVPESAFQSKKDMYMHLCDHPVLIDEGRKSFWLDKRSGKKCFMVAARDLYIAWGNTTTYWQWISLPESRFPEVAELHNVCWLEIKGQIQVSMLSPGTEYAAYFVYTNKSRLHGFDSNPVEVSVCMSGEEGNTHEVSMVRPDGRRKERSDGWNEVELGEFLVWGEDEDGELNMSFSEVKHLNWKSGIIVQGIEIRPKDT